MKDQEHKGTLKTNLEENDSTEIEKIHFSEESENCFACGEKLPKKEIEKCPYCGLVLKD